MSQRKTSASVAVVKGERLVGEDAAALAARFPEKVYSGFRDMLGKKADDATLLGDLERLNVPFDLIKAENRSTVAFQTDGSIGIAELKI